MDRNPTQTGDSAPSKSQRKREARELFELGRRMVELQPAVLKRLPLTPALLEAIEAARGIRAHGGRKRQLQFIAKLLRNTDAAPIREALDAAGAEARRQTVRHHRVESWRDELLTGGDMSLSSLISLYPAADPQSLRQLLRNAGRESKMNKPPAAARKLFRLLREMDASRPLPPIPGDS